MSKRKFSVAITDETELYQVRKTIQRHMDAKKQIAAIEAEVGKAMSDLMSELAAKHKAPRELNVFIDASKLDDHNVVYLSSQEYEDGGQDPETDPHTIN